MLCCWRTSCELRKEKKATDLLYNRYVVYKRAKKRKEKRRAPCPPFASGPHAFIIAVRLVQCALRVPTITSCSMFIAVIILFLVVADRPPGPRQLYFIAIYEKCFHRLAFPALLMSGEGGKGQGVDGGKEEIRSCHSRMISVPIIPRGLRCRIVGDGAVLCGWAPSAQIRRKSIQDEKCSAVQ